MLIHVGFAMTKISEKDALDQMRMLAMLGEAEQAVQEVTGYGLEGSATTVTSRIDRRKASPGDGRNHAICR